MLQEIRLGKCEKCVNWNRIKGQDIPDCILTYSGDREDRCYNFKRKKKEIIKRLNLIVHIGCGGSVKFDGFGNFKCRKCGFVSKDREQLEVKNASETQSSPMSSGSASGSSILRKEAKRFLKTKEGKKLQKVCHEEFERTIKRNIRG